MRGPQSRLRSSEADGRFGPVFGMLGGGIGVMGGYAGRAGGLKGGDKGRRRLRNDACDGGRFNEVEVPRGSSLFGMSVLGA